jgi:hypothetical protein
MRKVTVNCGPYAAPSATNIRTASSIAAAGAVTLNGSLVSGGVATLDNPRRVLFTSSGNDSGINFTIIGTDWNGQIQTEVLAGANATTTYTYTDFKTVTSISSSGASAGTVSIGTNAVASSRPVFLDLYADAVTLVQTDTNGLTGINYTIQTSQDDPNDSLIYEASSPYYVTWSGVQWINSTTASLVNATAATAAAQTGTPTMIRVLINNAGSNPTYSMHATFSQASMVPY